MKKFIYLFIITFVMAEVSCDVETSSVFVSSINLNTSIISLKVGETSTLTATVLPTNANDKSIIWSSNNEAVATVDDNGVVTAKGKGTANIIVTSKSSPTISSYCVVNVTKILNSLNIIKNLTLTVGTNVIITTNVLPKDASDTTVTWSSSDEALATISAKGEITTKAQGTVILKATSKSNTTLFEVCTLKISKPLTSLGLITRLTLEESQTFPLATNVTPKDSNDTTVLWTSSSPDIATVNVSTGLVTAKTAGTTKIRATSKANSNFYEELDLTVFKITVKSISISPSTLTVAKGRPETLNVTYNPIDAFDKSVTWTSSDPAIARVVNGKVYAVKEGNVTITATLVSNAAISATCTVTSRLIADVLTFNFEASKNAGMTADANLVNFNDFNYGGNFRYIGNNKLVATFTISSGATVSVNGASPVSGTTVLDYTSALNFEVTSADRTLTNTYRIALNVLNDSLEVTAESLICKPIYKTQIKYAILADSMNGFKVTKIGKEAFGYIYNYDNFVYNTNLLKISFPNSLEIIDTSAFQSCLNLAQKLELPNSLKIIKSAAFSSCQKLFGDLIIPNSVIIIERSALSGCRFNATLTIGSGLTELSDNIFSTSIFSGELIIPTTITKIGSQAFYQSTGYTGNLVIPNSVVYIGSDAFARCGFVGTLTLGNSLEEISLRAFSQTKFTGTLSFPSSLKKIGNSAFEYDSTFTGNLVLPNNITNIGGSAFSDCTGFNGNLTISSGLTIIEPNTFNNCKRLSGSLTIPNNVTEIKDNAFKDCIGFNGTLTIGTGVKIIGTSSFENCTGFQGALRIPENVTDLGNYSFNNCTGFSSISYHNATNIYNNTFYGIPASKITTY